MPPAVGIAIAGISSGIAGIAGSRSAAGVNRRAIEAQERDSQRSEMIERENQRLAREQADRQERLDREKLADSKARYESAQAFDRQRWTDYLTAHQPHWQLGSQALLSLTDLMGAGGGGSLWTPPSAEVAAGRSSEASVPPAASGRPLSLTDLATVRPTAGTASGPQGPPVISRPLPMDMRTPTPRGLSLTDLMAMRTADPRAGAAI